MNMCCTSCCLVYSHNIQSFCKISTSPKFRFFLFDVLFDVSPQTAPSSLKWVVVDNSSLLADAPVVLTVTGRTGWTTAVQMRSADQKHDQKLMDCVWESLCHTLNPIFRVLRGCTWRFPSFQTKDKMCDNIDTTYLYPLTTTIVSKTTPRGKEGSAGGDTPSTTHPPTSAPTEGNNTELEPGHSANWCQSSELFPQVVMDTCAWQDVKWSAFAGNVLYWYRCFLFYNMHKDTSLFRRKNWNMCCVKSLPDGWQWSKAQQLCLHQLLYKVIE